MEASLTLQDCTKHDVAHASCIVQAHTIAVWVAGYIVWITNVAQCKVDDLPSVFNVTNAGM